jgi:chemotaxis protein CheX
MALFSRGKPTSQHPSFTPEKRERRLDVFMSNFTLVAVAYSRHTPSVQIAGRWEGAVCLDMGIDLAHRATASLVGADPAEISHDDIRDAAGELANMTAGGIKELLPDPCQISLPTVVMGTDYEFSVPQGVVVYGAEFDTKFGKFLVTIIQRESDQPE